MKRTLLALLLPTLGAQGQSLQQRFDSLTAVYQASGHHGVVLVAKADTVLYQKAYGYADLDRRTPHTTATLFKTESVGKMFTATAVLQLVERGKLRLTQTVAEVLPALKVRNADKITIDHLLRHTSGLQSPWDHPQWRFKKQHTKDELTKIVEEVPLAFDVPGKQMFYSNSGYFILGWMVEKASGQPFDDYLQANIFSPLGMLNTRHLNDTVMPRNGAQPYRIISAKKRLLMDETVGPKASAAGGWISNAEDLYRFVRGLNGGQLLKPETVQLMRTANGAAPTDLRYRFYAYGLETYVNQLVPGVSLYGHNGGGAGFSVDAFVEPQSGVIVVSCTNLYQNSRPIAANYFRTALGKPLQPVAVPTEVRLYNLIDSVGIENLAQNAKEHFARLQVDAHPGVFAELSDAMRTVGDHALASRWLALGRQLHPEEGFLFFLSGENEAEQGRKKEARALFQQAKALGEKRNDERLLRTVTEKLAAL